MRHVLHARPVVALPNLAMEHSRRVVYAIFVFTATGLSIGIIAAVAYASGSPLIVPSLGPTAFLVFNRSSTAAARPRNIIIGHLIGAGAGYASLLVFGLEHAHSVTNGGLTAPRIGAAAFSIAVTAAVMILFRSEHGPAGATTLIVSLGFMTSFTSLGLLMAGVLGLTMEGVFIDRIVGLSIPLWSGSDWRSGARLPSALPSGTALKAISDSGDNHHRTTRSLSRKMDHVVAGSRFVVGPTQGRHVQLGTAQPCLVKVEDARAGDGSYCMVEFDLDPMLPATLLHAHYDFTETYFILEGEVLFETGSERSRVGSGSTITVPAGLAHSVGAAGQEQAHCLCVTGHSNHSDPEFLP